MTISRIFLGGLLGLFWFLSAWAQDTTILAASAPLNMPQAIAVDTAGNSLYRDQGRSGHERRRAVEASSRRLGDDALYDDGLWHHICRDSAGWSRLFQHRRFLHAGR